MFSFLEVAAHRHRGLIAMAITAIFVAGTCVVASANVLTDPVLTSGPDAIDPSGVPALQSINAEYGNVSQVALEARSDFQAIHNVDGGADGGGNSDDIIAFSDGSIPDVRFEFAAKVNGNGWRFANAGKAITSLQRNTSDDDPNADSSSGIAYQLNMNAESSNGGPSSLRIELGSWDGATFTSNTPGVEAMGFVLTEVDYEQVTVSFLTDTDVLLQSTTVTAGVDYSVAKFGNNDELFFAHQASIDNPIGYALIEVDPFENAGSDMALDDLGFTPVVPEPASWAGLMLGSLIAARRRRS